MGEIVGAGLVAHAPTIMFNQQARYDINEGKEISLVPGLQRLRTEVLDELKPDTMTGAATTDVDPGARQLVDAATQILTQLGESRADAAQLVERALAADSTIDSADALVTAAFRLKRSPEHDPDAEQTRPIVVFATVPPCDMP